MLCLLLGKDWKALRKQVLSELADDVRQRKPGRVYMVPELVSHEAERALCAAAGDTASRYAEVLSFTRLCRSVSDAVGALDRECLDGGGRVVAMAAAARILSSRLKAYAALESKPEFLKELVDGVDEFKRCCITPEDLKRAAEKSEGAFAQKLEELGVSGTAHFTNCVGLYDENHYCTVTDMALILRAAMENDLCREVLNARKYETAPTEYHPDGQVLSNWFLRRIEDRFPGDFQIIGAKTGYVVQAGSCAVSCGQGADGKRYFCATGDASSAWRAIYDHTNLYQTYCS